MWFHKVWVKPLLAGMLLLLGVDVHLPHHSVFAADPVILSLRVRYHNERIAEVFDYAARRSPAFRQLIATIDESDVIVYIEEGRCLQGAVRACLQIVPATRGRYVRIRIDPRQSLISVVRQLAHELQHAAEIATAFDAVDDASVKRLYQKIGYRNCWPTTGECWETRQAQAAEIQVAREAFARRR